MAKVNLQKLKEHNVSFRKDNQPGVLVSDADVKDTYTDDFKALAKDVNYLRSEKRVDSFGRPIAPSCASFTEILQERYGLGAPKEVLERDPMAVVKNFMKQIGVNSTNYSLSQLSDALDLGPLSSQKDLLNLLDTKIATGTSFIIQEVFNEAIRLGVLGNAYHNDWIARRQPVQRIESTSPQMLKGNARVRYVGEAESIEFGTVKFGQKKIKVRKVGTGVQLTDELIFESSIDMLAEYLVTVGEDMSLAMDYLALEVLKNGEQADLSESAPIIGSDSGTGFAWKDLVRVMTRMNRLKHNVQTIITREGEGIDLSLLSEFKGFDGVRMLSSLNSITTQIPNFNHTVHGLVAADHLMFLDRTRAMLRLQYQPMRTESRRNPQTQQDEFFVSDWVGFSILRRDARIQVDRSTAFSGAGFPAFMDVDSYEDNPFSEV